MQNFHFDSFLNFRKFLVFPDQTVTSASSHQRIFKRPAKSRILDIIDILQFHKTITERRPLCVIITIIIWAVI